MRVFLKKFKERFELYFWTGIFICLIGTFIFFLLFNLVALLGFYIFLIIPSIIIVALLGWLLVTLKEKFNK